MQYWNPLNKRILYFHITYGPDDNRIKDYYLKVDTIDKRVWKLQHKRICTLKYCNNHTMPGIYELKWATFTTGTVWNLKPKNINFVKNCEKKDGKQRSRVKHTTEQQWNQAVEEYIKSIK